MYPRDPVFEEVIARTMELGEGAPSEGDEAATADLTDVVRHRAVLAALADGSRERRELEDRLDVSRATSYRLLRWLRDSGLVERIDGDYALTGKGQAYAEEVERFARNLGAADRLEPLLDAVCETHADFLVAPFEDATVSLADPADPYAPVSRFLDLLADSETFRGFNATHVLPPPLSWAVFDGREVDLITLPAAAEELFESVSAGARTAAARGDLNVRTRAVLPYGLALFDDRVGVAGYDETTGAIRVLADTDSAIARAWAERTFERYRADAESVGPDTVDGSGPPS